jgi:hypothetical protein
MNIDMQLKGYFQLEIIDFSGQCIKYGTYAGPLSLDLSNISDGIYLVRIMFGTNVYSRKIVKMK